MARIALGCYEGFIHGFDLTNVDWKSPDFSNINLSFAIQAHDGGVKCLAMPKSGPKQGRLLVSGGQDELIRIYDLEQKVELGELQQHSGTITALEFFGSTHLLSVGEDKAVVIWRVHDWAALHVLGGHKGTITSIAVHPTGKLAMTASIDRTIRCWDLVNGRNAYISRVEGVPEHLCWSKDGSRYAYSLQALRAKGGVENPVSTDGPLFSIMVQSVGESSPCGTASFNAGHIEAISFLNNNLLAIAQTETGNRTESTIILVSFPSDKASEVRTELQVEGRIRGMKYSEISHEAGDEEIPTGVLVAVTSGGKIQIWTITIEEGNLQCADVWSTKVHGEPRFVGMELWLESCSRRQDTKTKDSKMQHCPIAELKGQKGGTNFKIDQGKKKKKKKKRKIQSII